MAADRHWAEVVDDDTGPECGVIADLEQPGGEDLGGGAEDRAAADLCAEAAEEPPPPAPPAREAPDGLVDERPGHAAEAFADGVGRALGAVERLEDLVRTGGRWRH